MCLTYVCDEYFSSVMCRCERPASRVIKSAQKMTIITAIMSSEHIRGRARHDTRVPSETPQHDFITAKTKSTENKSRYAIL